jgi:hypothetical protein
MLTAMLEIIKGYGRQAAAGRLGLIVETCPANRCPGIIGMTSSNPPGRTRANGLPAQEAKRLEASDFCGARSRWRQAAAFFASAGALRYESLHDRGAILGGPIKEKSPWR